jgi:hypothetical protein
MKAYVLDTDVLVAAFRSDTGASRQVLEAARGRRFDFALVSTFDAGIRISFRPVLNILRHPEPAEKMCPQC